MTKTQDALKERIQKAQEIAEAFQREYDSLPKDRHIGYGLDARIISKIQVDLVVSERKALEYLKLVKNLKKYSAIQQDT